MNHETHEPHEPHEIKREEWGRAPGTEFTCEVEDYPSNFLFDFVSFRVFRGCNCVFRLKTRGGTPLFFPCRTFLCIPLPLPAAGRRISGRQGNVWQGKGKGKKREKSCPKPKYAVCSPEPRGRRNATVSDVPSPAEHSSVFPGCRAADRRQAGECMAGEREKAVHGLATRAWRLLSAAWRRRHGVRQRHRFCGQCLNLRFFGARFVSNRSAWPAACAQMLPGGSRGRRAASWDNSRSGQIKTLPCCGDAGQVGKRAARGRADGYGRDGRNHRPEAGSTPPAGARGMRSKKSIKKY
jgi:hypothetical protein